MASANIKPGKRIKLACKELEEALDAFEEEQQADLAQVAAPVKQQFDRETFDRETIDKLKQLIKKLS